MGPDGHTTRLQQRDREKLVRTLSLYTPFYDMNYPTYELVACLSKGMAHHHVTRYDEPFHTLTMFLFFLFWSPSFMTRNDIEGGRESYFVFI